MYVFVTMHADLIQQGASIEFNPKWKNSTGYLDHIVHAEDLPLAAGEQRAFIDDYGRRAIVTGTPLGNVVVFERHRPRPENKQLVMVGNSPSEIDAFLGPVTSSSYDESVVAMLLGGMGTDNIGQRLESLAKRLLGAVLS